MILKIGVQSQNSQYVPKAAANQNYYRNSFVNSNISFCGKKTFLKSTLITILEKTKSKIPHKIIIVSGPSGVGKSSIIRSIENLDPNINRVLPHTTRNIRPGESHGKDAYYISQDAYNEMAAKKEFIQQKEFNGNLYGYTKNELIEKCRGGNALFDIASDSINAIKKVYGKQVIAIFIKPPSMDILEQRLIQRGTETPLSLQKRLEDGHNQLKYIDLFDKVVVNSNLETATDEVYKHIESSRSLNIKLLNHMINYLKKNKK